MTPLFWIRIAVLAGALSLLTAGYFAWAGHQQDIGQARATAVYEAQLTKQKGAAKLLLEQETAKVKTAEKALQDFSNQRAENDLVNERTISVLAGRVHALGRLRDPGATVGRGGGGSGTQSADSTGAGDSQADGAETGRFLSAELTEFLRSQAASADEVNAAYASCREDAFTVRALVK